MKPVTIAGGGLSGLMLGLLLRRAGVPVTLLEAGEYPRHRVCGEFVSGRGVDVLQDAGLMPLLERAGAKMARSVLFCRGENSARARTLPEAALCVSRWTMDQVLVEALREAGAEVRTGERYTGAWSESVVRATGRRIQKEVAGWRWFGVKCHARGVQLQADLEMHLTPHGYVGLCAVEDGRVNVSGLFRSREPVPDLASRWLDWLGGDAGSALRTRVAEAAWDADSLSFVAGLDLRPATVPDLTEFAIGDSVAMIPPATGNGMSMALESAKIASAFLTAWSYGELTWTQATGGHRNALGIAFGPRLRWSARLQQMMTHPFWSRAAFRAVKVLPSLQDFLFRRTR